MVVVVVVVEGISKATTCLTNEHNDVAARFASIVDSGVKYIDVY